MVADDYRFFREMCVRICGSLEIEKALWHCLLFIREFMPIDELQLYTYDHAKMSLRIIAASTKAGGKPVEDDISLTLSMRRELERPDEYPRIRKVNNSSDPNDDPFTHYIAVQRNWPSSSLLINRLVVEGKYIAAMVARVHEPNKYTDDNLALYGLINEPAAIAVANSKRYREMIEHQQKLEDDKSFLQDELHEKHGTKIIGSETGLNMVMDKVNLVARMTTPVLLTGETGVGKEVIANAIHKLSPRSKSPLITLNCGAIPETLIDSELFGHEKGAFTGATSQKRGRFERAEGGTIFLDEVSELPPQAQVRLLRVLQEKEFERIGGAASIKVDVRVVSATNRRLEDLVAKGLFRKDLYFRLNVFPILIPSLRERKEDIPALVHYFIAKKSREMAISHPPRLKRHELNKLMAYDWPGNVRELENIVERALITSVGKEFIFPDLQIAANQVEDNWSSSSNDILSLQALESLHIKRVLDKTGGKVNGPGGAAELLNVNSGTLRARSLSEKYPLRSGVGIMKSAVWSV